MLITPCRTQSANPAAKIILGHSHSRIKYVSELRILGVTLTADFKWSVHAANTGRSITKMVGIFNRFSCSFNTDSRCRIFNAFIKPKMIYCLLVWYNMNKNAENAADHILCRAAHVILHSKHTALDRNTFRINGIMPFTLMSSLKCLATIHTLLQCDDHLAYLPPLFPSVVDSHRTTRNSGHKFVLQMHKTSSKKLCFHYSSAKFWNNLPIAFHLLSSKAVFIEND